jgi:hypothetical protein
MDNWNTSPRPSSSYSFSSSIIEGDCRGRRRRTRTMDGNGTKLLPNRRLHPTTAMMRQGSDDARPNRQDDPYTAASTRRRFGDECSCNSITANRHELAHWIFFVNRGEFRIGDYEEIINRAGCLSLLSNGSLCGTRQRSATSLGSYARSVSKLTRAI